ncbi:hypothetical protein Ciccas_012047 [Cichlidogyrus casuarinus]|uniref:Uncharacterized protein n=1 Tax=Cichlidogyrus casuarinus TaxID=1844966 RepID=A0ABD2PPJ0_9PLAT
MTRCKLSFQAYARGYQQQQPMFRPQQQMAPINANGYHGRTRFYQPVININTSTNSFEARQVDSSSTNYYGPQNMYNKGPGKKKHKH